MNNIKNISLFILLLLSITSTVSFADDVAKKPNEASGKIQLPAPTPPPKVPVPGKPNIKPKLSDPSATTPATVITPAPQAPAQPAAVAEVKPKSTSPICRSGDAKNTALLDLLKKAKKDSEITQAILADYTPKTEGTGDCPECDNLNEQAKAQKEDIAAVVKAINPELHNPVPKPDSLLFNDECLKGIAPYQSTTAQYTCDKATSKPTLKKNLCVDDSLQTYQNQTLSNFTRCFIEQGITGSSDILPTTLLNIYTIENGFKPQYSSGNGVGLGQLTSIFIDDVKTRGKVFSKKILSQPPKPECKAAALILEKDQKTPPSRQQVCKFMSVGEGLERNMLYSMLGLAVLLKDNIDPLLNRYNSFKSAPEEAKQKMRELALTNSYGSGGPRATAALIKRIHNRPINGPEIIEQYATAKTLYENNSPLNRYLVAIKARESETANKRITDSNLAAQMKKIGNKACLANTTTTAESK